MILAAHIIFASAVSSAARFSLPGAFLFGLVSHHLLDFIPHLDAGSSWSIKEMKAGTMPVRVRVLVFLDILASLGFLIWGFWGLKMSFPLLFWASLGAALPDIVVTGFPFFISRLRNWPILKRYEKFHYIFFRQSRPVSLQGHWILGNLGTLLIIGFSFWLLLK